MQVGEQQWLGVAASLGQTVIATVLNPFNLINRLDDVAQDVSNLQLTEKIWQVVRRDRSFQGCHHGNIQASFTADL